MTRLDKTTKRGKKQRNLAFFDIFTGGFDGFGPFLATIVASSSRFWLLGFISRV